MTKKGRDNEINIKKEQETTDERVLNITRMKITYKIFGWVL
jgi:hypothetical protein